MALKMIARIAVLWSVFFAAARGCSEQPGKDYWYNDIAGSPHSNVQNSGACCSLCQSNSQCKGFGYHIDDRKCWLKTRLEPKEVRDNSRMIAGSIDPMDTFKWSGMTTDGRSAIYLPAGGVASGLRCSGRYCDDVWLLYTTVGTNVVNQWWTGWFSEELSSYKMFCGRYGVVTGLQCSGSYCDNMKLQCTQYGNSVENTNCYWSNTISEEHGGRLGGPPGMFVNGMTCDGRYCDNILLYLCQNFGQAYSSGINSQDAMQRLAEKFAPRLRFDKMFGTDSGSDAKCFPGNADSYYNQRQSGNNDRICNQDYSTLTNNQVSTYYTMQECDTSTVMIRYWIFYAYQSACGIGLGKHDADWEAVTVTLKNGELFRVAWNQHDGWYTKPGDIKDYIEITEGTHPVTYVGKNSHGSYHNSGGIGGCGYFDDFRNPHSEDKKMDTWNNLVRIHRGWGAADWMMCMGNDCFDGIGHPLDKPEICDAVGCMSDGCNWSMVNVRRNMDGESNLYNW